jgi:hypothetical protein
MGLIDAELNSLFAQLGQDLDIAPAQRFRLEGLLAAARADGAVLDELLQFCRRNAPPNCEIRVNPQRQSLQLDFWQRRAPVYPSTRD